MRLIDPPRKVGLLRGPEMGQLVAPVRLQPHRKHFQIVFQDLTVAENPRWMRGAQSLVRAINFGTARATRWHMPPKLKWSLVELPTRMHWTAIRTSFFRRQPLAGSPLRAPVANEARIFWLRMRPCSALDV